MKHLLEKSHCSDSLKHSFVYRFQLSEDARHELQARYDELTTAQSKFCEAQAADMQLGAAESDRLRESLHEIMGERNDLAQKVADTENEARGVKEELEATKTLLRQANEDYSSLKSQSEAEMAGLRAELDNRISELGSLRMELSEGTDREESQRIESGDQANAEKESDSDILGLKQQVAVLSAALDSERLEKEQLQSKIQAGGGPQESADRHSLDETISRLETELELARNELEKEKEVAQKDRDSAEELHAKISQLECEVETMRAKIACMESEGAEGEKDTEIVKAQLDALCAEKEILSLQNQDQQAKILALEEIEGKLAAQIGVIQSALDSAVTETARSIAPFPFPRIRFQPRCRLQSQLQESNVQVCDLQSQKDDLSSSQTELRDQLAAKTIEWEKTTSDLDSTKLELERVRCCLEEEKAKNIELERKIETSISDCKDTLEAVQASSSEKVAGLEAQLAELGQVKAEVNKKTDELNSAENALSEVKAELGVISKSLEEMAKSKTELEADHAALLQELEKSKKALKGLTSFLVPLSPQRLQFFVL